MSELRYPADEVARLGDLLFDREIAPRVSHEDPWHFVAIAVESGAYEVDSRELAAIDRLRARNPAAQIYIRRVGSPYVRKFRPRPYRRYREDG